MLEGLCAGHTQKKNKKTLSCLCRRKKVFKRKFFFSLLKPQSNMLGLALISLLSAPEPRAVNLVDGCQPTCSSQQRPG